MKKSKKIQRSLRDVADRTRTAGRAAARRMTVAADTIMAEAGRRAERRQRARARKAAMKATAKAAAVAAATAVTVLATRIAVRVRRRRKAPTRT